jgi:hypothetical protein
VAARGCRVGQEGLVAAVSRDLHEPDDEAVTIPGSDPTDAVRLYPIAPPQSSPATVRPFMRSEAVAVNNSGVVLGSGWTETEQHVVVSRDGVVQDPGGFGETGAGGWAGPYFDEEAGRLVYEHLLKSDMRHDRGRQSLD